MKSIMFRIGLGFGITNGVSTIIHRCIRCGGKLTGTFSTKCFYCGYEHGNLDANNPITHTLRKE